MVHLASDTVQLAEQIVEDIIKNLNDRSGFDGWYYSIDDDIREEMKEELFQLVLSRIENAS